MNGHTANFFAKANVCSPLFFSAVCICLFLAPLKAIIKQMELANQTLSTCKSKNKWIICKFFYTCNMEKKRLGSNSLLWRRRKNSMFSDVTDLHSVVIYCAGFLSCLLSKAGYTDTCWSKIGLCPSSACVYHVYVAGNILGCVSMCLSCIGGLAAKKRVLSMQPFFSFHIHCICVNLVSMSIGRIVDHYSMPFITVKSRTCIVNHFLVVCMNIVMLFSSYRDTVLNLLSVNMGVAIDR